jgi:hypothetical protein
MSSFHPSCYLPLGLAQYLPSAIACPPPTYAQTLYSSLTSPFSSTYSTISGTMGALASVPFLSFLIVPIFGSWSTSLNLIFFYLTWATLVLSHGPLRVEIISTLAIRALFYLAPSLFFFAFDALVPSAAESFKAMGSSALPLKHASRQKTLRYMRFLGWSMGNILLSTLLQTATALLLKAFHPAYPTLNVSISLPAPFRMFTDLLKGYLARELLTYTTHRFLLHSDSSAPIPSYLTAVHESWYHSLPTPIPLSASYDHPLAYAVRVFIPQILPAIFFRFHLLTYLLYLAVVSLEETFAYSGYSSVPTNFILGGIARRVDGHVACGGQGNFGAWGLGDWVCGTSVGGDLLGDVEDEADKHDVQGKVKRKISEGKRNGRKMLENVRRGTAEEEKDDDARARVREKVPRRRRAGG